MVFAQASNKLNRKSKTTYSQWCEDHEIPYHDLKASFNNSLKEYVFNNLPLKWGKKK